MKVYNTGHATIQILVEDFVVYVDPFVIPEDAKKADLILITHNHYDHFDKKKIAEISKENTIIVHYGCDCEGVELKVGETKVFGEVSVTAVQAYNTSKEFHPKNLGVGYVIEVEGKRVYHAGDTDVIPEMSGLGHVDLACLPIAGTYTMNEEEAVQAVKLIKPVAVMPMHYDSIVKGDVNKFKKLAKGLGVSVFIKECVI